jgi:hypothetical protein
MKTKSQTGLSFDAYKNYKSTNPDVLADDEMLKTENNTYKFFTEEEFINKIKTDNEFAKKWGDFHYNETSITVNVEPKVVIDTGLLIDGFGRLPIKIIGDFTDIPERYHEIFMMAMMEVFPQKEAKVKPSKPKETKSFGEWFFDALFFKTKKK